MTDAFTDAQSSHRKAWQDWSQDELGRLLKLPIGERVLALKSGAGDHLLENDLDELWQSVHCGPKSALLQRTASLELRTPMPLGGKETPIKLSRPILILAKRFPLILACLIAIANYSVVFSIGRFWLIAHSFRG
jgi:hypothetical protein